MKKIKARKDKVAMFYQAGFMEESRINGPRLRMIFPNGKSKWIALHELHQNISSLHEWTVPCWADGENHEKFQEAIKAMRKFDRKEGYKRATFIGYI